MFSICVRYQWRVSVKTVFTIRSSLMSFRIIVKTDPNMAESAFRKRAFRQRNIRKQNDSDEEEGHSTVIVKREKKIDTSNPLIQSTNSANRKPKKANTDSSSDDEVVPTFKSKRICDSELPRDMGATATLEIEVRKGPIRAPQSLRVTVR